MSPPPVHLLKGSDPILLGEAAGTLVATLLGDRVRTEVVDEFSGDDYELSAAVMAASSVSMFGDRLVVVRQGSRFGVDELAPLIAYLADPNPTSTVVIVWDKPVSPSGHAHPVPKKLSDAVKAAGGAVTDCDAPVQAKARQSWLDDQLSGSTVKFLPAARSLVADRLGEDVNRIAGLIPLLESSYPPGTKLTPEDVAPFLGGAGSAPPWDLTDAIDRGDVPGAIDKLHRMMGGGDRHPLQIMASLQTHFERMLRLDGAGVRNEQEAAERLGMKKGSTFPAKKAMEGARRLGSERVATAIRLLAEADVALRGAVAWPPELVMEVLVGRLARLNGRR